MRRVPSTFTLRDSSSGRSKETEAAQWTTVETSRRSRSRVCSDEAEAALLDVAGHGGQPLVAGSRPAALWSLSARTSA